VLPFRIELKAGLPVYEQVLYAARKAIISGDLKPGDAFPSVRAISKVHRINPNTVQKAITVLKQEGLIEIHPGIGARVCAVPQGSRDAKRQVLEKDVEALVLRAKQLHLDVDALQDAIREHWEKL
jgi:GntR family transcriptional regulator